MPDDDERRLAETIQALNQRFGSRTVSHLTTKRRAPIRRLTTGFDDLDVVLDGGLPRGRIAELVNTPTAGMTTLALKIVAQAQAQEEHAVYLDLGRTFDPAYAVRCGVILDRLLLVHTDVHADPAREGFGVLRDVAEAGGVVVCDLPFAIATTPALRRRLAQTVGRLLLALGRSSTVLLCLVTLPPGQTPGDFPLQHYATTRLLLERERWLYRGEEIRGYRARVLVAKHKLGTAGKSATIDITLQGP